MARKNNHSRNSTNGKPVKKSENHKTHAAPAQSLFTRFACEIAHLSGKPATFLLAVLVIVVWAVSGPFFGYSDTWQLVINTGTTVITFLMVFLIQNTQNRDTMALQIKLAELIFVMQGAKNKLATVEDMSDEDLECLHQEYRQRADETFASLTQRRSAREKAADKAKTH
jgi:low affinity Fe/Cu permease